MEIDVATHRLPEFAKVIKRLAKVAVRFGLGEVSHAPQWGRRCERILSVTTVTVADGETVGESTSRRAIEVVPVAVTLPDCGKVCAQGEWSLIGALEKTDHAGIFEASALRAHDLDAVSAFKGNMECAHCHAKRQRTKTLILRSAQRTIQVGRECAQYYLSDAATALAALAFQEQVTNVLSVDDEWCCDGAGGGRVLSVLPVDQVLANVCAAIRLNSGVFVPSSSYCPDSLQNVPNEDATWRVALSGRLVPTAQDETCAASLVAWVENLVLDQTNEKNEFLLQLQGLVGAGWVSDRKTALLAALPSAKSRYDREQEVERLRATARPLEAKRQVVEGTVKSVKSVESTYGWQRKMVLELDSGHRVYVSVPAGIDAEVGMRLSINVTVEPTPDALFAYGKRPTLVK